MPCSLAYALLCVNVTFSFFWLSDPKSALVPVDGSFATEQSGGSTRYAGQLHPRNARQSFASAQSACRAEATASINCATGYRP